MNWNWIASSDRNPPIREYERAAVRASKRNDCHGVCAGCAGLILYSQSHTTSTAATKGSPASLWDTGHWHTECWNDKETQTKWEERR